ncbi:hypothetical protein BKA56DRAFT_677088 [Ilyonectria sp. MPI-CAGE-AT-0026]|nr:hypothetical protein BKA56DRAFT_677088 [Ilyonectria sp. MPI-CAGE-AT-0026]
MDMPWWEGQLESLPAVSTEDGINSGDIGHESHQTTATHTERDFGQSQYGERIDVIPLSGTASSEPTSIESHRQAASDAGSIHHRKRRTDGNQRPSTVLYSHYRYLSVGNLHSIPHQDVSYLEAQGCLHVPTRPTLDNFVEQYFAQMHVLLPLIHEGEFWDMYSDKGDAVPRRTISLLVFQAMLFASCTFVPQETIQKLGFSSLRTARTEFYRRTKLLYDLETESEPLPLAQAALLMMGWVPPSNTTLNPYQKWLAIGIQHARSINADRYAESLEPAIPLSPDQSMHHNALRRLWWCCIILDRVSPLCTRFRLHITHDRFDFKNSIPLGMSDLEGEMYRSSIFTPATKRRHIALFTKFLEFIVILTDVLTLVFPFDDSVMSKWESQKSDHAVVERSDALLKDWYARASAQFPPHDDSQAQRPGRRERDKSVILHTQLMYIYYHTAAIALCHYKILRESVNLQPINKAANDAEQTVQLDKRCKELQDSTCKMTQCFGNLTQRRLTRWLPITAVACLATPLALHVMTARLSCLSKELAFDPLSGSNSVSVTNQNRLDVLVEAMKTFVPQYDGVEWVKEVARHVANLAQINSQSLCQADRASITDWSQMLTSQPNTYLRMTWTVDVCMSKGRLPEERDFPAWLRDQLGLAKGPKPHSQREQPRVSSLAEPRTFDPGLNYDPQQSIDDLIPSLAEFLPTGQVPGGENDSSEFLTGSIDTMIQGYSGSQTRDRDVFAGEASQPIDVDGMEWALFGVMEELVER